jgi:hypothetical protein
MNGQLKLENDPEFISIFERMQKEGMTDALMDKALDIRRKHTNEAARLAALEAQQARHAEISKLSAVEKIALGLKESAAALGATPREFAPQDQDISHLDANQKMLLGLRQSMPARPMTGK